MAVEECLLWANQRVVFGKPLIAQPGMCSAMTISHPNFDTLSHYRLTTFRYT